MRGDAYGRELLNAAHRQGERHFSSSPATSGNAGPAPMLCVAISDRASPLHSILGRWLVEPRIALRIVGQLALDCMLDDTRG